MPKVLIATTNPGKMNEYRQLLQRFELEIVNLSDLKIAEPPEETGATYAENSLIKANYYWQQSKLPTIADDSGLEIDALGGEPGIHSRRIDGQVRTDAEIQSMVLDKIKDLPEVERTARLKVVITLRVNQELDFQGQGVLAGVVKSSGAPSAPGFPFRSIFWVPVVNKFYKDFTTNELLSVGHRAAAIKKLEPYITQYL